MISKLYNNDFGQYFIAILTGHFVKNSILKLGLFWEESEFYEP